MPDLPPSQPTPDEPPAFDREAARARYRKLMRSWPMRLAYIVLVLTILFAWAWGIAAAVAPDVEHLPHHDLSVPPQTCINCHTVNASANNAPRMNHPAAPSCGFCHRQSLPDNGSQSGRLGGWVLDHSTPQLTKYALH